MGSCQSVSFVLNLSKAVPNLKTVKPLQPIIEHKNLHLSRQLSGLLGDVILDSDWLSTTLRDNRQQCIKIEHSLTMY